MAFEVARVHQLICSRVGDEGVFDAFKTASHCVEADQRFPRSCSPEGSNLHMYYPASSVYGRRGFDHGHEACNPLTEASSCSTETESDDEDGLLKSLAQQIAQSMLDEEEAKAETPGVLEGNRYTGAQDVPNMDVSEGRVSPSSWSSGSWLSGPQLSSSQSSSKGSSRVSSQVSSPSSAPSSGCLDAWDTLYAAAGEIGRLKMNDEKNVPVISSERPSPAKVLNQALRPNLPQQTRPSGQMTGRSAAHAAKRKEEMTSMASNQAQQNWAMKCAALNAMATQGRSPYPIYQHQQQAFSLDGPQGINNFRQPVKLADSKPIQRNRQAVSNGGSGVRVVFLGGPSGRESGGTGVFLPRTFPTAPEHKKRNDVPSMHSSGVPTHSKNPRDAVWPTLQQSMIRPSFRQPAVHEPFLPTEWTY